MSHPFYTEYEPLRKICIQILKHDGLSFSNNKNKVYGLLIDVAWLWEEYLHIILRDLDFEHPENKTGDGKLKLFKNRRDIYPDFYNIERSIVIDAKYKRLNNKELSREDVYQVVTYMYRLKAEYGILLYPTEDESNVTRNEMHDESYGGENALFIKCGLKIPKEMPSYIDYTSLFHELELWLKDFLVNEKYKKQEVIY